MRNGRTGLILGGVGAAMLGLAFASAPLYDLFCRVTGFGGTTGTAEQSSDRVLDEMITIRFDGSLASGMGWQFRPETTEVKLHIGETGIAYYRATNISERPIAGTAAYNVTPYSAGGYFIKIACFCFTQQVLQPGESVLMPVTFYVDPEILDDPEAKYTHTITLSYTFMETEMPADADETAAAADLTTTEEAGSDIN